MFRFLSSVFGGSGRLCGLSVMIGHPVRPSFQTQIIEELRSWINGRDQQLFACPGACHVKQVPFGVVDLFKITVVGDCLNS